MADDLTLGRGKLFFQPYLLGETTGGALGYFGDTTEVTLAETSQDLDHYNSEAGIKVLDKSVVLTQDMTITFATDNINEGNLALWFGAAIGDLPADAPTDVGDLVLIGDAQSIYGAMIYKANNPIGSNRTLWVPYCNLKPNGNFALKGDTWQSMSFSARVIKRDNATGRAYWFQNSDGTSAALTDVTPEFDRFSAAVSAGTLATGGTVVESGGTAAIDEVFTVSGTLTGGTVGYLFLHDGTTNVGAVRGTSGATWGPISFSAHLADTYTVKLYDNAAGTGSPLTTSGNIVVS